MVNSDALIPDPQENLHFIGIYLLCLIDHFTNLSSFAVDFFDLES